MKLLESIGAMAGVDSSSAPASGRLGCPWEALSFLGLSSWPKAAWTRCAQCERKKRPTLTSRSSRWTLRIHVG